MVESGIFLGLMLLGVWGVCSSHASSLAYLLSLSTHSPLCPPTPLTERDRWILECDFPEPLPRRSENLPQPAWSRQGLPGSRPCRCREGGTWCAHLRTGEWAPFLPCPHRAPGPLGFSTAQQWREVSQLLVPDVPLVSCKKFLSYIYFVGFF